MHAQTCSRAHKHALTKTRGQEQTCPHGHKHSRVCINALVCTWKCLCTQAKNYLPVGCVMMMVGNLQIPIECEFDGEKILLRKKQILCWKQAVG